MIHLNKQRFFDVLLFYFAKVVRISLPPTTAAWRGYLGKQID